MMCLHLQLQWLAQQLCLSLLWMWWMWFRPWKPQWLALLQWSRQCLVQMQWWLQAR